MPVLHEVQQKLREWLAGVETGVPSWVLVPGDQAAERLEVYRATVLDTLVRALRLSFPTVHRLVGAEFFGGAGQVFAGKHLPKRADLNTYGDDFPDFLQSFAPCAGLSYLADVARLDWAVMRALHASDAAPMDLEALAAVDGADAASLRFTPHPSLALLRCDFPADDIWRSVLGKDDGEMAAIDLGSGPVHLVVERVADRAQVSRLSAREWSATVALMRGVVLAQVMEAFSAELDVPALLAIHLAAGRFDGFQFSSANGGSP